MTLPRILVALLSLLPAPLRRKLILALLRRFLYRAPARGRSGARFRPYHARHELAQRARRARALLHGAALAAGDLALLCRDLAQDIARAFLRRAGERALHLNAMLANLVAAARTRVPSRASATPSPVVLDPPAAPPLAALLPPPAPARPAWAAWRERLRAQAAVDDWLVWDAPPPSTHGMGGAGAATATAAV